MDMKSKIFIFYFFTMSIIAQEKGATFFNPVINPSVQISNRVGIGIGSLGVVFNPSNSLFSNNGILYKELLLNVEVLFGKNVTLVPNVGFQLMNFDFIKRKNGKFFTLNASFTLGNLNYIDFKNAVDGRIYLEIDFGSWLMVGYRFAQPTYGVTQNNIGKHSLILRYYFPLFFNKPKQAIY